MRPSRFRNTVLCGAALFLSSQVLASDITLSGTVLGVDGKPYSGVSVSLAQAGLSTVTDAAGNWALASAPVGIQAGQVLPSGSGHLLLDNGRLSVRFSGCDLLGRGGRRIHAASKGSSFALRALGSQDTLLYSLDGMVRLRDTVTGSRTGVVRTLDLTLNPAIVYGYLTDERDEQTYRTVKIGTQVWMAQNLNYAVDSSWCPAGVARTCTTYGRLYQWSAMMGVVPKHDSTLLNAVLPHQGICPSGWHVPSDTEWGTLVRYVDQATGGTKLKANSSLWNRNPGTDTYGFSALPPGFRDPDGAFFDIGLATAMTSSGSTRFWTSTESDSSRAWFGYIYCSFANAFRGNYDKRSGYSLRCLQGN